MIFLTKLKQLFTTRLPSIKETPKDELKPCDYCEAKEDTFSTAIGLHLCWDCMKEAFDKVLKNEKEEDL